MLKVRLIFRRFGAVSLALLAAGGCSDLAGPMATSPAPSMSASYLDVEEPQSLGSPQLVSANVGTGVPGWEQAGNIGPLPDSAWIMVEVRGTVLHTKHPWCDQLYSASGGCNYTLDGVRLGPLERHGGSGVIVSLLPQGEVPHPYFSNGDPMYAPDGNIHGDVARMVVRNTTGPKVVWFRRLDATPKPGNATTGVYGPMYYMSSDQKVTARVIPPPVRVDAPAVVRPGEVVTFSVSPTADFKFKMSDSRPHFVYWRFFPGDTAARPNQFGPRHDVPCDSTVCRWTPEKSGRMWAFTYVDGFGVDAQSQIVRVDSARLELTCPASVTRGMPLSCTVAARPNGALTDITWRFVPPSPHPNVTDTGRTAWTGPMVLGGRIEVSARVNGEPQLRTDTATVAVNPRNWAGRMPYPAALPREEVDPSRFPRLPVTQAPNGFDQWGSGTLGTYVWDIDWFGRFQPIGSGPNEGFWYLREPPVWREPVVYLSGHLEPGHPSGFYEAQTGQRPGEGNPPRPYTGWCTQADMNTLLQEVRDHEGSVTGPRLSHHEFNMQYTAQHDPGPVMEGLVLHLSPTANFASVAEAAVGNAYETAMENANNAAVHAPSNLYTVPCKVHFP